ncbi:MAG: lactate utilization protein [Desulfovibrio sp.]|jgi:L-lactate utilization protein LutB|nr:lactate utilization protein [Desulfovibrio sp.]
MNALIQWHNETLGKRAVEALKKNKFQAEYFHDPQGAAAYVAGLVPHGASVGIGGTWTEREIGLTEHIVSKGCTVFDHGVVGLAPEERNAIRYKQITADVFISGSNAITLKGELVNRDAFGNRVAAMMFGPKKVIIIAGTNKIVRDLEEAEQRIKMYAAPINNKRYETPNPCVQLGECVDCNNKTRICNITTIISRCPPLTEIHVAIIGGRFGF